MKIENEMKYGYLILGLFGALVVIFMGITTQIKTIVIGKIIDKMEITSIISIENKKGNDLDFPAEKKEEFVLLLSKLKKYKINHPYIEERYNVHFSSESKLQEISIYVHTVGNNREVFLEIWYPQNSSTAIAFSSKEFTAWFLHYLTENKKL